MADGAAGFLPSRVLAVVCLFFASHAGASCLSHPDPAIRQLQLLVYQDARSAQRRAQTALDSLATQENPAKAASLYAVLGRSYSILELDGAARDATQKGLALVTDPRDPVHLDLLSTYAENVYDPPAQREAATAIEKARAAQAHGSPAEICLTITLGRLQFRLDRADSAILNLTRAYRASMKPALAEQRMLAADVLSSVLREMGDHAQALALNQEAIDWDMAHAATLHLSVSRFLRGAIYMAMHEYESALAEIAKARQLSEQLGDEQGVAFADLHACESRIELGQLTEAEQQCNSAMRSFAASGSADMVDDARTLLAQIDLAKGRPERTLAVLNATLARDDIGLPPRQVAKLYRLRAQANAALHHYRDAYDDLDKYMQRYVSVNEAERTRQATAIRTRFETDRAIERSASLQRDLDLARLLADRRKDQLHWTAIVIVTGALTIALLVYILIANLRHRRELVNLASQDALTGLPNRRRTAELATTVLRTAHSAQIPLTLAVIDLDHFKTINDRHGHAAGDYVLKEFAARARESLRAEDILGRWGGEEFLLVMPATTLDTALSVLERLRDVALAIRLPQAHSEFRVTLSAGLALNDKRTTSLDDLIASADCALYEAKQQGRDLVRVAEGIHLAGSTGARRAMPVTS